MHVIIYSMQTCVNSNSTPFYLLLSFFIYILLFLSFFMVKHSTINPSFPPSTALVIKDDLILSPETLPTSALHPLLYQPSGRGPFRHDTISATSPHSFNLSHLLRSYSKGREISRHWRGRPRNRSQTGGSRSSSPRSPCPPPHWGWSE